MNEQDERTIFVVRTVHEEGAEVAAAFPSLASVLQEVGEAFGDEGVQHVTVERVSLMPDVPSQGPVKMPRVSLAD